MLKNINQQTEFNVLHLKEIFNDQFEMPEISAHILFVNPLSYVKIEEKTPINIIQSYQLLLFLDHIDENKDMLQCELNKEKIFNYLNPNAELFFMDRNELAHDYHRLSFCYQCGNSYLEQRYKTVFCQTCQQSVSKNKYIEKLIDEYCLLMLTQFISARDIANFCGNFFSARQIGYYLPRFLTKYQGGRHTNYINPYYDRFILRN